MLQAAQLKRTIDETVDTYSPKHVDRMLAGSSGRFPVDTGYPTSTIQLSLLWTACCLHCALLDFFGQFVRFGVSSGPHTPHGNARVNIQQKDENESGGNAPSVSTSTGN